MEDNYYLIKAPLHHFTTIDGDDLCKFFARFQQMQQFFLLRTLKEIIYRKPRDLSC